MNESDPTADPLSAAAEPTPEPRRRTINGGMTVTYAAAAGCSGADSFTSSICDGRGGGVTMTVAVTVSAPLVFGENVNRANQAWSEDRDQQQHGTSYLTGDYQAGVIQ